MKQIKVHIKRMELFAVLTLRNAAGQRYVTTLPRGIQKTDPIVREMIRRFNQDEKVIDKRPARSDRHKKRNVPRSYRTKKRGVGTGANEQGVLV